MVDSLSVLGVVWDNVMSSITVFCATVGTVVVLHQRGENISFVSVCSHLGSWSPATPYTTHRVIFGVVKIVEVLGMIPMYPRQKLWIERWSAESIPGVAGHAAVRRRSECVSQLVLCGTRKGMIQ